MSTFLTQAAGTVVLWALSGGLAMVVALLLAAGSVHRAGAVRLPANVVMTAARGVPTSLLVIAAGIAALTRPAPTWLPDPFPGTAPGMALVGWAVTIALALGTTGHLAAIFRTGYHAIDISRRDMATALGLGPLRRMRVLAREAAPATVAPTGARLVHHLHNTAFAALFPIADLFGWVQTQASATFQITRYAGAGIAGYMTLSVLIWAGTRGLEHWLRLPATGRTAVS